MSQPRVHTLCTRSVFWSMHASMWWRESACTEFVFSRLVSHYAPCWQDFEGDNRMIAYVVLTFVVQVCFPSFPTLNWSKTAGHFVVCFASPCLPCHSVVITTVTCCLPFSLSCACACARARPFSVVICVCLCTCAVLCSSFLCSTLCLPLLSTVTVSPFPSPFFSYFYFLRAIVVDSYGPPLAQCY